MTSRVNASLVETIALSVWLGAAVFFSAAVAPALFAVLPARSLAGLVVGRLLPVVFYIGMLIGALVLVLDVGERGAGSWRGRGGAAAIVIAACAVAQWIIGPRIDRVRASIPGAIDDLPAIDPRRVEFGRLHGISVAWLGLAMLAALVALVLSVRALGSRR